MKNIFYFLLLSTVIISCGVKVPYTTAIRDEFGLDTDAEMKKLQFYTSSTIILKQAVRSNSDISTDDNGALVSSSSSEKETIIIPSNTKCVFDGFGTKGELKVRFESGSEKTLTFVPKGTRSKRFYFYADWKNPKGPKVKYGKNLYTVDRYQSTPQNTYLKIVKKSFRKTKSKQRVIKGMDVN